MNSIWKEIKFVCEKLQKGVGLGFCLDFPCKKFKMLMNRRLADDRRVLSALICDGLT